MDEAQPPENQIVHIQKLPFELVRWIIQLETLSIRTYAYRLQTLRLVHPVWRDVIENSPLLWARIDTIYPVHVVRLILQRSKNVGLTFTFNSAEIPPWNSINHFDFIRTVLPYSTRCESFVGTGRGEAYLMQHFLQNPTPAMTSLDIRLTETSGILTAPIKLGDGRPLSVLTSHRLSFVWDSPRLSSMTSLALHSIIHPPSPYQLIKILSSSPNLQTLALEAFDSLVPDPITQSLPRRSSTILLPKLEDLLMSRLPSEYYYQLIPRLRASDCQRMAVGHSRRQHLEGFGMDSRLFAHQDPGLLCLLRKSFTETTYIRIRARSRGDVVVWTPNRTNTNIGPHPCLILLFHSPVEDRIKDIGRFISNMNLDTPVELRLQKEGISPTILLHLPKLRGLRLDCPSDFTPYLDYLSEQRVYPNETEPRWVAPDLESIEMRYEVGSDAEGEVAAFRVFINDRWNNRQHCPAVPKLLKISKTGPFPPAFRNAVEGVKDLLEVVLAEKLGAAEEAS